MNDRQTAQGQTTPLPSSGSKPCGQFSSTWYPIGQNAMALKYVLLSSIILGMGNRNLAAIPPGGDTNHHRFAMTEEGLARLPRIGEVKLSDAEPAMSIDIGDCYVDTTRAMAVEIINSQTEAVSIRSVKATCGCTAAFPLNESIASGGRSLLIVTVRPGKTGAFGSKLTLATELGDYSFTVEGVSRSRVRLAEEKPVTYDPERQAFLVKIIVKVPSIDPSDLRMAVDGQPFFGTPVSNPAGEVHFELPDRLANDVGLTHATTHAGTTALDPLLLPLWVPGRVKLIRDDVYTDGKKLRLLLTGDVQSLTTDEVTIEIDALRHSALSGSGGVIRHNHLVTAGRSLRQSGSGPRSGPPITPGNATKPSPVATDASVFAKTARSS